MIAIVRFKALPGRRFKVVEALTFDNGRESDCYSCKDKACDFLRPLTADCPEGAFDICNGPIKTVFEEVK